MPVIHNTINIGDLSVRSGSLIVTGPSSSIIIEPDNNITGSIRLGNDKVYTTGSNAVGFISRRSIEPFWTNHDNQGQYSVINGGDLHSIDANTKYGGIQSGFSSSLVQQCGSNIAGGIQNKILPGIKGVVPANSILGGSGSVIRDSKYSSIGGGSSNLVDESQYSSILGGSNNCIEGLTGSFVIGTNIAATASCTTFVNCLNIQNIDNAVPTDQLLVRNSTGLVRQGPSITDVSGSGTNTVIQVPGIVNPDRDVYVTGSNSVDAIATSSIEPFFMPSNVNEGKNSVISSGYLNRLIQMCSLPPENSGIFSGQYNAISGSDRSTIEGGNCNKIKMGHYPSASIPYTNYACDHSIQNGTLNEISNKLPSIVRHVTSTGFYQSGSCQYFTGFFNYQSPPYNVAGTGSIVWFEHSTYAGFPGTSGPQTSGSQAVLTQPIVIQNYGNAIQNGVNNKILDYSYLNVIDGGETNLIKSAFFPQRYGIGNPNCAGKTLYFRAAHRNFIGAGAQNYISGASFSGVVAGVGNAIAFDEPGRGNDARSFIGAGCRNTIAMTKMSGIGAGNCNRITRPGGFNFIGGGRCNTIHESIEAFIGAGSCNNAKSCSAVVSGRSNRALNDGTFIGAGVNNCNNSKHGVIGGGFNNVLAGGHQKEQNIIGGGKCNRISANCQSSILGGFDNKIQSYSNRSSIVGGESNRLSISSYSSILGGKNNLITGSFNVAIVGGENNCIPASVNDSFIMGSNLVSQRACTSFVNSFDISGSLDMNLLQVPTSSIGLRTGQVYRTGSSFDELRIKL